MSESFPTFLEVSSFSLFPCVPPGALSELCFSETEHNTRAASEVVSEVCGTEGDFHCTQRAWKVTKKEQNSVC